MAHGAHGGIGNGGALVIGLAVLILFTVTAISVAVDLNGYTRARDWLTGK